MTLLLVTPEPPYQEKPPMTDTSPEALDALEKRLRDRLTGSHPNHKTMFVYVDEVREMLDTIAALRAAPVAIREGAEPDAGANERVIARFQEIIAEADKGWRETYNVRTQDHWMRVRTQAEWAISVVRALPLDAPAPAVDPAWDRVAQGVFHDEQPAPVDPVAEAVTVAIPRRLVPEVLQWLDDEIAAWPEDTAYQADLGEARDSLAAIAQETPHD
jgi:hypothetical protein